MKFTKGPVWVCVCNYILYKVFYMWINILYFNLQLNTV